MRILLVEHNRLILRENRTALLSEGYEVICAEDGELALEMARKFTPDLILLNMILPKLNGSEVLKHLKKNQETSGIPVVVVSSLSKKNRGKLMGMGAEDYLEKKDVMPSRNVNLLSEMLAPIIGKIQDAKKTSAPIVPDQTAGKPEKQGKFPEEAEIEKTA